MKDLTNDISSYFGIYELTPSAIGYVARQVREKLVQEGAPQEIVDRTDECEETATSAQRAQYDWRQKKKAEPRRENRASKIDAKLDQSVSSLFKGLKTQLDLPPDSTRHQLAREVIDDLFPEGVYPITSLRYEDEHGAVQVMLNRLDAKYSQHISQLGLDEHVALVTDLNDKYGEVLTHTDDSHLTYADVRAARKEANARYRELLVVILAEYVDDDEARARVTGPVRSQNEWTARYYKRRGESPEVDPETGDPVDGDVPPEGDEDEREDEPEADPTPVDV